jgi:hypothetical protein
MADESDRKHDNQRHDSVAADPPRYQTLERTWLSPDDDDPQRDEAADRARKAVRPGHPRE